MKKLYTITVITENKPGVLYRISDLFLRRKINVESLTVADLKIKDQSRFTIVVQSDETQVEKIVKQLYRIIEVVKVIESTDENIIAREISLFRVSADNFRKRKSIEQIVKMSQNTKIVDLKKTYIVIEKSGTEKEIDDFYVLMKPFGIQEFVQSGRIAIFNK